MEDQRNNEPEAFERMTPLRQQALRLWIRLALQPSRTVAAGNCNFSYSLKHRVEEAYSISVSNGEMKGAMVAEGYSYEEGDEGLNWYFNSSQRCPHRMGERRGRLVCPMDGKYVAIDYGTAPALCQATPEELATFEGMRAALWDETIARQAALREQARDGELKERLWRRLRG
jgi:hypothetical protein